MNYKIEKLAVLGYRFLTEIGIMFLEQLMLLIAVGITLLVDIEMIVCLFLWMGH